MSRTALDVTGHRFGRLDVLARAGTGQYGHAVWLCRCDCGNETVVRGGHLRSEKTRSCGCLHDESAVAVGRAKADHGRSREPIYSVWANMITRCLNPNGSSYPHYGGRGVKVCDRWLDFEHFAEDMGERPPDPDDWTGERAYWSLDRIDVNGNYEPANCHWASWQEQRANRRPEGE